MTHGQADRTVIPAQDRHSRDRTAIPEKDRHSRESGNLVGIRPKVAGFPMEAFGNDT